MHIYNGIGLSRTKYEIMPLAATWMDLEIITLSAISQTETDKYMISLICGISKREKMNLPRKQKQTHRHKKKILFFLCFFKKVFTMLCWFLPYKKRVLVTQSCPTVCNPMDCSPPDSSVHGILQARILEWGAISFSNTKKGISHNCTYIPSLWNPPPFPASYPSRSS